MGRKNKNSQGYAAKNQNNLTRAQKDLNDYVDKLLRISTIPQQQHVQKALDSHREIHDIIEKIKSLEANKDSKNVLGNPRNDGATIAKFADWAGSNGAEFKSCTIKEFDGYDLGLQANVDIPKSNLIIAVPRQLMLTINAANQSELGKLIENDQILKNMPNVTLAIFLLLEKYKENSFYKPYIDILPKTYTTVLYFSIEELDELKGSPTLEIALRQIKSIARQYAYFHKLFSTSGDSVCRLFKDKFTFKEYCWAVSTVMTRQNTVPFENESQRMNALIPLWDLCNHTNGTITTGFNPTLDRSECLALRNYKKGDQLFIFYGARSNADLFIHNGFVYEDNEHDSYWVRLGVSKSDRLQEKRTQLLSKISIPSASYDFCIKKGHQPIDGQLLAFSRIFNMNENQLDHWLKSDKFADLQYMECGLDTDLEKKSWCFLQARLKLLLATYKTSLGEDEKLIAEPGQSSPNRLLAIRMRAAEKRIIRDTLEYVEQYIKQ